MLGWVVRILLVIAGFMASLIVTKDALNFAFVQMVIAVILFTIFVAIIAFWPILEDWFKRRKQ